MVEQEKFHRMNKISIQTSTGVKDNLMAVN